MVGTLRGYLGVLGFGFHILSGLFALGLAVNFVWSLLKRDFSLWWFWPAGMIGQERLRSALAGSVWCPAIQRRSW